MVDVCFARQPIFDATGDVAGYDLLYQRTSVESAESGVDRPATGPNVLVQALLDTGLDRLAAGRAAHVNFSRDMLLTGVYTLLPPTSVVIVLLEHAYPDEKVEGACAHLVNAGYTLALGDFAGGPSYRRLLELATVVKVNVLDRSARRLDEVAQEVAAYDVRLVAQHVETAGVQAMCAGLGYELFQGGYYARPEVVQRRPLAGAELAIVHAMNVARDHHASDADVEAAFASDARLTEKLIRCANAPARGGRGDESIREAVQHMGRNELSKWLALLLVSSIATRETTHRELLHLAVQRARMCELLAVPTSLGRDTTGLFLVGLFSLLDVISGLSMTELLEAIALESPLGQALIARSGPHAEPLCIAEAYEQGAWSTVSRYVSTSGLDVAEVGAIYVQSVEWTRERLLSLSAG